ncbi:hypothetical protein [Desulfofustis glycolicus]|uniref:Uncharacterized protein n=1 Tax=Desulfofustis glycolicus DSM 9705 TaxID=1121409 RepID=A0A1M5UPF0_9BACT|nr:hypothetical protein [Desulfofustis glycolicus]MCB2217373.1 hypothetical protein [Desulfobulbaceae bacterium]SHH64847.1 hypothetical protein SAMN02745124_01294 [Desulfofustis glycolicus DSM 9705]
MVKSVIHFFLVFALIVVGTTAAEDRQDLDVYFFYSANCPHCHHQMGLMQAITANNPEVTVHFHEISKSSSLWRRFLEDHSIGYGGVPRTFVGETTFIGYAESGVALTFSSELQGYLGNRVQIVKAVEKALGHPVSLGSYGETAETDGQRGGDQFWPLLLPLLFALSYLPLRRRLASAERKRLWLGGLIGAAILAIFLLLAVLPETVVQSGAQRLPYPLFVFTIALADGFNPCAFTVLVILLSLLSYTKNRRDMLLLGTTFIATSAVMYFLFIMALVLLGGFFLERFGRVIMLLLGALVTGAGLLNIKDFFFLKKGFSLGLSEEQQLRFSKKASRIVKGLGRPGARLGLAVGGTIMLGIFVNLVELGCTAILPAVYLTTLVSRYDGLSAYSGWTAFYCLVYILPLLAILLNFVYVFKSVRLTENQGRLLKLTAGAFMLFFGLLMIFKPELLAFG